MQTLFEGGPTNMKLTVKPTSYSNPAKGITEPQRRVIKALASGKGNYLIEHKKINNRKCFRCLDRQKNIVGHNFKMVVVKNLVSKGMLLFSNDKYFLK